MKWFPLPLLAMSLLSRLSVEADVELPLALLFEVATLEQLAKEIDERKLAAETVSGAALESGLSTGARLETADRMNELSDEEVDALLKEILKIG